MAKKKTKKSAKPKKKMRIKRTGKKRAGAKPRAAKKRIARVRAKRKVKKVRAKKEKKYRIKKPTRGKSQTAGVKEKNRVKVEALIKLGRERGYITYDEIIREFPTIEDNMFLLEEIYERFSVAGIDVLEGGGMLEDNSAQLVLERKKLQNRRADSGYDSVQMYLREIGQHARACRPVAHNPHPRPHGGDHSEIQAKTARAFTAPGARPASGRNCRGDGH